MLKQKTFIFDSKELGTYLSAQSKVIWNEGVINKKVDRFLKDKELVLISTNTICRGNNPPSYALVYTVIYKENEKSA